MNASIPVPPPWEHRHWNAFVESMNEAQTLTKFSLTDEETRRETAIIWIPYWVVFMSGATVQLQEDLGKVEKVNDRLSSDT